MNAVETPSFETPGYKRIYEYIEHAGAISSGDIRDQVQLESAKVDAIVADLQQGGYIIEYNGRLELALGARSETTHQLDGTVVTIRPARQQELPVIIDTIHDVIEPMRYPSAENLTSRLTQESVLKRHNDAETRTFFVPTVDDDIVGWVHIGASTLQRVRHTVELTLGIRDGSREQGIGSQLLERGCEWAASNTYQKACQRFPATNERALAFLESHNWVVETIRRNHYDCGDERIDEVVMAIEIHK